MHALASLTYITFMFADAYAPPIAGTSAGMSPKLQDGHNTLHETIPTWPGEVMGPGTPLVQQLPQSADQFCVGESEGQDDAASVAGSGCGSTMSGLEGLMHWQAASSAPSVGASSIDLDGA